MAIKDKVKRVLPLSLWTTLRGVRHPVSTLRGSLVQQRNSELSAEEVFSSIYLKGGWGRTQDFDSGYGSRDELAQRHKDLARAIIEETGSKRAVDIGCGDFRVASGFVDLLDSYTGIDVVPSLIERNVKLFGGP